MGNLDLILAAVLAVGVIAQLCLPLVGRLNSKRQAADLARKRAKLLQTFYQAQIESVERSAATKKSDSND